MDSTKELRNTLRENPLPICHALFPAGKRNSQHYCVGSLAGEPGKSLKICIAGKWSGRWQDYAGAPADKGGNLLDLIMRTRGVDFPQARRLAREWLGQPTVDHKYGKHSDNSVNGTSKGNSTNSTGLHA